MFCLLLAAGSACMSTGQNDLVEHFLKASEGGQCIESVTYQLIGKRGTQSTTLIVQSALIALSQHEQQQRALGCTGDIAAQAIAAGADPTEVLQATAAGL